MDSKAHEKLDSKAEFRKPSNDAANRKYRRRSSVSGSSSSSDGSPYERSPSPVLSSKDSAKVAVDKLKRNDDRDLDRDYGRNQSNRSGDSYKHSDRYSSRSYHRHDDRSRRDTRLDDYDRGYSKSSYRSIRDSQDSYTLHYSRGDRDHRGSRDYPNDVDKYSREKSDGSGNRIRDTNSSDRTGSGRRHANIEDRGKDKEREKRKEGRSCEDEKKDYQRSSADHKSNLSPIYEYSKGQRSDSSFQRDSSDSRFKDHVEELDGEYNNEHNTRRDNWGNHKEQFYVKPEEHSISDGTKAFSSKDQDSVAKKLKLSSLDNSIPGEKGTSEQLYVTDADIDAAKTAAMKAAELVNRNLVGTGVMSADQKKKLLWGHKKNTNTEESTHHWDMTNFGDRERQEKFNKLMGVKGNPIVENQSDNPDTEKEREKLQLDLEKQYTAGLRRRDGRTVGLGL